jgi:hypothetical protein
MLARDLGLLARDSSEALLKVISEIARMLHALRTKVELAAAA